MPWGSTTTIARQAERHRSLPALASTLLLALALVLTACSTDGAESSGERNTESTKLFSIIDTELGPAIGDDKGFALYIFDGDGDTPNASTCFDNCARVFPPLERSDLPVGEGTSQDLLRIFSRGDGSGDQLAYNGWPLYRFSGDNLPGETEGLGSAGRWWLINGTGERLVRN